MNPYLTLHVAHSYLFAGNRKKFWEIFSSVLSNAASTLNYPEAIHPFTGGGVMGDGHHGWAAAEILSAIRDAFIFENEDENEAVLLQGIPPEWFEVEKKFSLSDSPLTSGMISIFIESSEDKIIIKIDFKKNHSVDSGWKWKINLPVPILEARDGVEIISFLPHDDYSEINLIPASYTLTFIKAEISRHFIKSI